MHHLRKCAETLTIITDSPRTTTSVVFRGNVSMRRMSWVVWGLKGNICHLQTIILPRVTSGQHARLCFPKKRAMESQQGRWPVRKDGAALEAAASSRLVPLKAARKQVMCFGRRRRISPQTGKQKSWRIQGSSGRLTRPPGTHSLDWLLVSNGNATITNQQRGRMAQLGASPVCSEQGAITLIESYPFVRLTSNGHLPRTVYRNGFQEGQQR